MVTIQGYFEAGKFVANAPTAESIPEHRLALVTIFNSVMPRNNQKNVWQEFFVNIAASNEEIPAEFPRLTLDRQLSL
ncbi:hypothetical protein RDn1_284 [Candidatus Termititenax dinenymphae]|uniref:Uncharacterized protein n=1 Tax=Candidatus Termititenax dinenymphae TaxID=2218523 RepID=A0A388TN44_9BACT|nr:hypothetical protein RDn1_284 [Candidatus Termititenax dinenymphae]